MKILLVQPNNFDPIALKVIGSYLLKNNVNVEIVNYSNRENLIRKLDEFEPQFVGINIWTGSMILTYLEIVDVIKNNLSDIKVIAGGFHPSFLPEQVMQESACDFVVCGDGETAVLKIINNTFEDENGILYRKNNKILGNTVLRTDPLDLVESIFYNYPPRVYKKDWADQVIRLHTSKGCPFGCAFCYHSHLDRMIRYKSLNFVKKELYFLKERYDISNLNFFDDNFAMNKNRVYEICAVLKELNIRFQFSIRIDQLDQDFVRKIKSSGCVNLYLGIESGSDRILKLINKNFTAEIVREKTSLLNKYELPFRASFMINLPTETKKDLADTKQLAQEIGGPSSTSTFSLYAPYPKTKLYDYIKENYRTANLPKSLRDWADINWFNYIEQISELSLEDIEEFCNYFGVYVYGGDELHKASIQ